MSRKTGNAQSRATFFRHSAVLSLPAVLLRKVANNVKWKILRCLESVHYDGNFLKFSFLIYRCVLDLVL